MPARGGGRFNRVKGRAQYKGPSRVSPLAVCDGNDGSKGTWPLTDGLIALRIPAVGTHTPRPWDLSKEAQSPSAWICWMVQGEDTVAVFGSLAADKKSARG